MDGLGHEIQHAGRRLRRSPAFTTASVLTLALAIGANAAIFAIVQRVVLNSLPYPESDRIIRLDHRVPRLNAPSFDALPAGLYYHYADRAHTLEAIGLYQSDEQTLTGEGEPERVRVGRVTTSMLSVLRVAPAFGRWFTEEEGAPGGRHVALLSHGLWVRRYGGDPAILGKSLVLGGVPAEIVGVMPSSFAFPDARIQLWVAEQMNRAAGFGVFSHVAMARLRAGASLADARAELNTLIAELPSAYPSSPLAMSLARGGGDGLRSAAVTLKEATIGSIERALWILLAAVALVFLVACANVANLLLVRSDSRQREVALRRALGATDAGIIRFFLAESLLLAIASAFLGLALAAWGVRLLVAFGPTTLPRLHEIRLDGVAVAFTFALSLLAALAFGAIPLLRSGSLALSLQEQGRGNTTTRAHHVARQLLMGGQVAFALVLLVASGLMVRSFQKLRSIDPGFDASSALSFRIGLPERKYATREAAVAAHQAILERLAELPGVTAASAASAHPLVADRLGIMGNSILVEGDDLRPDPSRPPRPIVMFTAVAGGYIEAMRTRLKAGRTLDRGDVDRGEPNALVNEAFVKAYFGSGDPIGHRIASSRPSNLLPPHWLTIVGVVGNTPLAALAEANPTPKVYLPMSVGGGPGIPGTMLLGPNVAVMRYVVRTATPPLGLAAAVRRAIDTVDADLALSDVRSLQDIVDRASADMAFTMVLIAIAGSVALLLGVIGIYGVMSFVVSQRTSEIGVRMALGAEPGNVARMIVRQGGAVTLVGITIGLACALATSRFIGSLLYGVSPREPAIFAVTAASLAVVALVACWVPARRAARLSPMVALRSE